MKMKTILSDELLNDFSVLLAEKMGLDFPPERWNELENKVKNICDAYGYKNLQVCIQTLIKKLIDNDISTIAYHLTIGETYFFRDPKTFSILEKHIFPEIFQRHTYDRTLKIWSAGCCTGEEPYSLAIMLRQMIPDLLNWNIQIIGTDINQDFLHKAEIGKYKKWSFRATPVDILQKYFTLDEKGNYHIHADIKKMVKFNYLNLAEDNYNFDQKNLHKLDLILCNNVLIYFSKKHIKHAISQFNHALNPHGWLSVTAIEAPYVCHPHFKTHYFSKSAFFSKETKIHQAPIPEPTHILPKKPEIKEKKFEDYVPKLPISEKPKPKIDFYEECAMLFSDKFYHEVIDKLLYILKPFQNNKYGLVKHSKEIKLLIKTFANQGNLTSALEWCNRAIDSDKLDPYYYYLQAEIYYAMGNLDEAITAIKRALFLNSNFVMAHYLYGIIERRKGNKNLALKELKIAKQLILELNKEEILIGTEDITVEKLLDIVNMLVQEENEST